MVIKNVDLLRKCTLFALDATKGLLGSNPTAQASDVDGVLHKDGRFVWSEFKTHGSPLRPAQNSMYWHLIQRARGLDFLIHIEHRPLHDEDYVRIESVITTARFGFHFNGQNYWTKTFSTNPWSVMEHAVDLFDKDDELTFFRGVIDKEWTHG